MGCVRIADLPNIVTLARLGLAPVGIGLILAGDLDAAFWVVLLAGMADAVDGGLARRLGAQTALGARLDPVADKLLAAGAFAALAWQAVLPVWLVLLVVGRDALILGAAGLLLWRRPRQADLAPTTLGKLSTASQMGLVLCALAAVGVAPAAGVLVTPLIMVVAATTVASGLLYGDRVRRHARQVERRP